MKASARLPSGVIATPATPSAGAPTETVSVTSTSLPWIDSTESVPSARLATSARSPFGLIASPEGCLPTVTVPITLGGLAFRSTRNTLLSGSSLWLQPSTAGATELATSAISPEGVIARLVGGPTTEFISGIVAVILGASGLDTSSTVRVSCPGSRTIGFRFSSTPFFSSLPTITVWPNAGVRAQAMRPPTTTVASTDKRICPSLSLFPPKPPSVIIAI